MALYLVRHGECIPMAINPDCPLSDRGLMEVKQIAALAAERNIEITKIFHSGKTRAMQTALILGEHLNPTAELDSTMALNPHDDIAGAFCFIGKADHIMLVSHLPFLEKLVSSLVNVKKEESVVQFPTAGMVCLDRGAEGKWEIQWILMP